MRGFDSTFIDELKFKNEIIEVVGKYVKLEQRGGNFWGRCPFHHEKTASFCVNASGQFYYCFGCHKSGDVISFIMEMESLDFSDAVKFLADKVKMPLPEVKYDDEQIKETKQKKERLLSLLKDCAMFYVKNLYSEKAESHNAYLRKRQISKDCATKFGMGASLDFNSLPNHLLSLGYTYSEMLDSGAVEVKNGRYFDALGGRLIVPIINQFNQVVAFGGRLLEKADFAKYKNTKETIIFNKSNTLYNINNLKKIKNERGLSEVIIVEGYMDTISLVQAGVENVVASMGTSLTKDQARIIKRYTDKVYISYDGDFAGQKASIRGLEILKDAGLDVKVVALPDGLDPDDVIKERGAEGYRNLLFDAKPLIDFKLDILRKTFDISTIDGKRKYISNAVKVIKESPSPAEQEDLLKTVRDLTGTTLDALKRELYSTVEDVNVNKTATIPTPTFTDSTGDKCVAAARFILYAYLFDKNFSKEFEISDIEFPLPLHEKIKEYIQQKNNAGEKPRFTDLYQLFPEGSDQEISAIAATETDENKLFDQAVYFNDCVKTLKIFSLDKKINSLSVMFSAETDSVKRRELAKAMSELMSEKNRTL